MIRTGLSPVYAGAIEATASTGGALLPRDGHGGVPDVGFYRHSLRHHRGGRDRPGAALLLRDLSRRARSRQTRRPEAFGCGRYARFFTVVRRDWYFFVPVILLVWFVLAFDRPVYSAAIALASLVPIALWRLRSLRKLVATILDAFDDALRRMTGIGIACAVAGLVVGTLAMTDLTGKISSAMFMLAKGSQLLTLMISTVVVIVLGMGMPTPAVYALSAVLAGPALQALGIPVLPAHCSSSISPQCRRSHRGRRRRLRRRLDRTRQSDGDWSFVLPAGGGRIRHSIRVHLPSGFAADRFAGRNRDIDHER